MPTQDYLKRFGTIALFDPEEGVTVREPLARGPGWWAGAPGVFYDEDSRQFYLVYRLRKPRELGRGVEVRLAASQDGVTYEDFWRLEKTELNSPSIERCSIFKGLDGKWRLYLSYVDPADDRWRTDVLEAEAPDGFRAENRHKVFTADDIGGEGVKDPVVFVVGRLYYLLLSYAQRVPVAPEDEARKHATADIFNTGLTISSSGLAVSTDGINFTWLGDIAPPRTGWDDYCLRLGAVVYTPPVFTVFYDGSASVAENYEEKCGLAQTFDLQHYRKVSRDGPILTSPQGSGSLRYLDVVRVDERLYYYYEYACADGSHELRVNVV
ncbi:MAG TPA: hypothetical protein EYP85_09285 [Armatimonadetes bacterium]|nr:hypothetical protein [Armatimonadota bacterium]